MLLLGRKARIADLCTQIATHAEEAILIVDHNNEIIFFNEGAEKAFGYAAGEVIGQKLDILLPERFHIQNDMFIHEFGNSEAQISRSDERYRHIHGRRKSGEEFAASATVFDLSRGDRKFYGALVRDISKTRKTEEELLRMAAMDPLTGAFNRREFTSIAEREALRSNRYHHPLSVLMFDIDNFKRLNEVYGHSAGDKILQRFTMICTNALRNVDVFGRWGGEAFVALLPETDIQGATVIAERLRKLTADNLLTFNDHKINFTVSIGIAEFKDGETSIDAVLNRADSAVYDAKKSGRDRISTFRN
jgi:diguanylate cyclase (GGDEF)-like protein/PAS domain S-box-containing protein